MAAGNGLFGCRDGAPKIHTKLCQRPQRPNSSKLVAENPAETPYSASYRKRAVCEDWMVEAVGHKLATHHPVIEPVSAKRIVGQVRNRALAHVFLPIGLTPSVDGRPKV